MERRGLYRQNKQDKPPVLGSWKNHPHNPEVAHALSKNLEDSLRPKLMAEVLASAEP